MATKSTTRKPALTVESLVATHESTPGPKRRTLRDSWSKAAMEAVMAGNADLAKVYAEAVTEAAKSRTTGSTAVEIPWGALTAERVRALRAAADMIESGAVRPSGTPADVDLSDLESYVVDTDRIESDAARLAGTRLAGTRNVPEFIAERVAELGDGWHTASDLARGQIDAPGTGAIGAVYAKMTRADEPFVIPGVKVGRNDKGSQAFHAE